MRGARNISWGSMDAIDCSQQDLVVTVWAPSTYLIEHEHNCLGLRPRIELNVPGKLGQIIIY